MFSVIPRLMGVLNVTPDSFYDGGKFFNYDNALRQAELMIKNRVDIIDIGGESTRPVTPFHQRSPNSKTEIISEREELERVMPVIDAIRGEFPQIDISIDTRQAVVAQAAIEAGVKWINYVTESITDKMLPILSNTSANIILCHMRGNPQDMQQRSFFIGDLVQEIIRWFQEEKEKIAFNNHKAIYLDPGIGFGKEKPNQDLEILTQITRLKNESKAPIVIGLSRKSFLGAILNKQAPDLLSATIAMNMWAMLQGADIIRVHDVAEHNDLITIIRHISSLHY